MKITKDAFVLITMDKTNSIENADVKVFNHMNYLADWIKLTLNHQYQGQEDAKFTRKEIKDKFIDTNVFSFKDHKFIVKTDKYEMRVDEDAISREQVKKAVSKVRRSFKARKSESNNKIDRTEIAFKNAVMNVTETIPGNTEPTEKKGIFRFFSKW